MDRREFLLGAGAVAAVSALPEITTASQFISLESAAGSGLSILQGYTNETTTQLSVDVPEQINCVYHLKDIQTNKVIQPDSVTPVNLVKSSTRVDKVKFSGLHLNHQYKLTVTETKKNEVLDQRFLKTVDLNKKDARIGLMSCMNDGKSALKKMWPSAEAANLDYLFFVGDAVYGDFLFLRGPKYLWSRFVNSRKKIPFYHWKHLKPVLGVWDDHDFGKNNAGGEYKHKNYSYHIFKTFFAQDPDGSGLKNGYANSFLFQAFEQNFAFYDNRYYRNLPNPDSSKGFLGLDQINWMSSAVAKYTKPTIVLSGSPMFGRFDKMSSYQSNAAEELEYFIKKVQSWNTPTLFVGGDLHYSEVSHIDRGLLGYNSYELISSCMHSNTKSALYDNPNTTTNAHLDENFMVLQKKSGTAEAVWKLSCVGAESQLAFEQDLIIS